VLPCLPHGPKYSTIIIPIHEFRPTSTRSTIPNQSIRGNTRYSGLWIDPDLWNSVICGGRINRPYNSDSPISFGHPLPSWSRFHVQIRFGYVARSGVTPFDKIHDAVTQLVEVGETGPRTPLLRVRQKEGLASFTLLRFLFG
jgi:hypothetical protein